MMYLFESLWIMLKKLNEMEFLNLNLVQYLESKKMITRKATKNDIFSFNNSKRFYNKDYSFV